MPAVGVDARVDVPLLTVEVDCFTLKMCMYNVHVQWSHWDEQREFPGDSKELFNLPVLVLKARHPSYSSIVYLLSFFIFG